MKVLSLFDGCGGARQALKDLNIVPEEYLAVEIDKYAKTIAEKNHPDLFEIGDINDVDYALNEVHGPFDLIIGGSPCTDLSVAKKGRKGLSGARSGLFWKMAAIIEHFKPKYFLLENVASMSKESKQTITKVLGVEPIMINSALVTAQSRKRLYWINIPNVIQPEDRGIFLKDIIEVNVDTKYFYSEKAISYLDRSKINKRFVVYKDDIKANCLTANYTKALPYNVYVDREKAHCVTSTYMNRACVNYNRGEGQIVFHNDKVRRLTPTECERLQGLPENYTEGVSNTQRYKMIGNGFTIPVIAHILSFMPVP